MSTPGYASSPWACEDGGPARQQAAPAGSELGLVPGETLRCVTRSLRTPTMLILGDPGEVFMLRHQALRSYVGLPTSARVEQIDAQTLKTVRRSPTLPGGPMWPGGMALHRNGDLYVVYGRHAHRLNRRCELLASVRLPLNEAYNSFVILDNGLIVTKNLSAHTPARLSVVDPESLRPMFECDCPEPSIARLSACGNTLYVVGVRTLMRYHWDVASKQLLRDTGWQFDYLSGTRQTYGWDVVLSAGSAWFMDNGQHRYFRQMTGAGVGPGANRLLRVSLKNAEETHAVAVSGMAGGSITNPPLVDAERRIVVGYDSANRYVRAWRFGARMQELRPLWVKPAFGCASHMLLYPNSGELVLNDYRNNAEEVVVLDIESGVERARVRSGGITQGVVFPCVGWERDFYWVTMSRIARMYV